MEGLLLSDGHPVMVTGSPAGHIALWNLEEKKLQSQMRDAHCSAVTGLQCLPSEPLLVTSSPDNSVKVSLRATPRTLSQDTCLCHKKGRLLLPDVARIYTYNTNSILNTL